MFLLTILIVSTSLGSVILDSNIQELCSKKYFDIIHANKSSDGKTTLLLERMKGNDSKSSSKTVHSWDVLIEEQNGNFKLFDISYTENAIISNYSTTEFRQPKECPIDVTTVYIFKEIGRSNTTKWKIIQSFIENKKIEKRGKIEVQYVGQKLDIEDKIAKFSDDSKLTYIESSQLSSISVIAILCKASDKSLYAIVEEEPPNAENRTQFVARLRAENYNVSHTKVKRGLRGYDHHYQSEQRFWLELMNHSIVDFLGIDCEDTEEDSEFLSYDTLFVMFWVLLGIGIILFIADTGLIIKREPPKPMPSYRRASRFGPLLDLMENKR